MKMLYMVPWLASCTLCFVAGLESGRGEQPEAPFTPQKVKGDSALDPVHGTMIGPDVMARIVSRRSTAMRRTFLVDAGECAGCTVSSLQPSRLPKTGYDDVVLVFQSTPKEIRQVEGHLDGMSLVSDVDKTLARKLNPRWFPRWYVVQDGRITKVQEDPKDANW